MTCRAVPVDDDRNPELPFPEDGLVANPGDGPPISGDFWVLLWRCLCGAYGVGKLRFEIEFRGCLFGLDALTYFRTVCLLSPYNLCGTTSSAPEASISVAPSARRKIPDLASLIGEPRINMLICSQLEEALIDVLSSSSRCTLKDGWSPVWHRDQFQPPYLLHRRKVDSACTNRFF